MGYRRTLCKGLSAALVIALGYVMNSPADAAQEVWRFDCGTADSPVMEGYQRLTDEDVYNASRGYGWEGLRPKSTEFEIPSHGPDPGVGYIGRPPMLTQYLKDSLNDLNRDAVVSESDLVFRMDVPPGTYLVVLTIGDMSRAIGSMDAYVNEELIGSGVAAWTPGAYALPMNNPAGWLAYVRATVEVTEGLIRIALKKNQQSYDKALAEQMTWENPYQKNWYWTPSHGMEMKPPWYYIGWPFVHNSLMAVEVFPYVAPPVIGSDDKLRLTRTIASPMLEKALSLFNGTDFAGAMEALGGVTEPDAQVAKAIVALWLVGRLETELIQENILMPEALKILRDFRASHPDESGVGEILRDAEIFERARAICLTRGEILMAGGKAVQKNHFVENNKAIGLWWMIGKDSPLYYKSRLYAARAEHMLEPFIPTLGTAAEIFKELEKTFPDSRYVRYHLHQEWENHGDGTRTEDWYLPDYTSQVQGSPEWVRELYPAWASSVDWAEWWVKFKQHPEGNIGGGWGDDVEMISDIAQFGYVCRDTSELAVQGMRNLCKGLWNLSEIDPELGFCLPMADAEHSAEWTGDTLDSIVQIDFGNPTWIERSMKTAKLMRDLWTDCDVNRYRHFRANYFGAAQVGSADRMNDSWINYRAVRPASAVLWYNQNPTISKLFVELADGWLAAAMSTDRGKPRGVIPAQVSFPDGILGGTDSPNWYTASHPAGTVNYDWPPQTYKGYIHALLMTAYKETGDRKYLDPLQLEYELASQHGNVPAAKTGARLEEIPAVGSGTTRDGSNLLFTDLENLRKWQQKKEERPTEPANLAPTTSVQPGSEEWVALNLKGTNKWLDCVRTMKGRSARLENEISKDDIIRHASYTYSLLKMRWPLMTTESGPTDRVAFVASINPYLIYAGSSNFNRNAEITYDNTTRNFAAAVMASEPQGFRILYHSLAKDTREIGIAPWELEPAAKYRLTCGPDANEDEVMDSVVERREFWLPQPGTPIRITVMPRVTYIAEVTQVERGRGRELAPDPGLSNEDIWYDDTYHLILARIHNVGSEAVRGVAVSFYQGDPEAGGEPIGTALIPNIEPPNDLEPRTVTVGVHWSPPEQPQEIYVVVDPDDEIKNEITTFNNVAHTTLPKEGEPSAPVKKKVPTASFGGGGRR